MQLCTHACVRTHPRLNVRCLAVEEAVSMWLQTGHPVLLQAELLTAAVTSGRSTVASGITASSSVAISRQLWPSLKPNHRDPTSLMSTDEHQMDNGLAFATGQSLAMPPRRLIMVD